jgi:2-desacetyl-2-hydroxyethyl bacteriochlorophyllide A dehydrogenase
MPEASTLSTPAVAPTSGPGHRRLLLAGPGQIVLQREPLVVPGAGQVLAETVISGISHGTEMAWFHGQAAALHKRWDADARVYHQGGPGRRYPIAPGYETVARVAAIGSAVSAVRPGDLVYLDRPHAEAHLVDQAEAVAGLLPTGVTAEQAVFWPLARVALGGVHDAAVQLGESVVVTGLGTVGLLVVQLARLAGARQVIGVDRYPLRLQAALQFGAATIQLAGGVDVAAAVCRHAGADGADVAIEASGSYQGLHEAIRACRLGGRVATVASYHGAPAGLALGEEYHRNRITLISSMTVNGCPQRGHPAWTLDRLNHTARGLLAAGEVDVDPLITHRVPFEHAEQAYELIARSPEATIKVVLTYAR